MTNKKHSLVGIISYIILILGLIWVSLPFIWMLLTAFKPANEVLKMPPQWIPTVWKWENFKDAIKSVPFNRYFFNSVFISIAVTLGDILTSILAAYAFSHIDFRFKKILLAILLACMMIPGEILMIPNYVTLSKFRWIDTYKALILPWCTSIFSILLIYQQFISLPKSYYKSAKINGCSDLRYLFTILIPCSIPTLASVAILKFINCWNSYIWPLIVTNSTDMRTLPVGAAAFSTEAGVRYNTLMAFSVLMTIPIILIYLFTQKYLVKSIGSSGIKG